MLPLVIRAFLLLIGVACVLRSGASAQALYVPGPRIEIPSLTPQAAAGISARAAATHFVRRDDGPRYVIYGSHAKTPPFPRDLTAARGRAYLDGFAAVAPSMGCRTDDVAHAYEFLLQAALLAYNGTHFAMFAPGPSISCGTRSFGAVRLDQTVHIYLGGTPAFARLPDRLKQAYYETLIVTGGYLLDNVTRARPGTPQLARARADAADAVRWLTGFSARRVHLTNSGVSIDDQVRP